MRSAQVISKLRAHFCRYGIPQKLRSDNARQFDCAEFRTLSTALGMQLVTSNPDYPQSNGQAEKAVDIAKRVMSKASAAGVDPYLALLEYRNTPIDGFRSPAQLLHGRNLRSLIPCTALHLEPATVKPEEVRRNRLESQRRQAVFYNRGAVPLTKLHPHQKVWVQLDKNRRDWKKAVIISQHDPSSYWLQTEDGSTYRRNRINIRQRSEPPEALLLEIDPNESGNATHGETERPNEERHHAATQQVNARSERPERTCGRPIALSSQCHNLNVYSLIHSKVCALS